MAQAIEICRQSETALLRMLLITATYGLDQRFPMDASGVSGRSSSDQRRETSDGLPPPFGSPTGVHLLGSVAASTAVRRVAHGGLLPNPDFESETTTRRNESQLRARVRFSFQTEGAHARRSACRKAVDLRAVWAGG